MPRKLRPDPKIFIQKSMAFCKAKFDYVRNTFTSSFYKFNKSTVLQISTSRIALYCCFPKHIQF